MVRGTGSFKTERGGGRNFSRGVVLDNNKIVVSGTPRGQNAKKEDATGTSVGAAQPQLTRTERCEFYKERAGASSQDLVLDQNASRASRGENANKKNAVGTNAGAAQPQPMRAKRHELQKKQAAQKQDDTGGAPIRNTVHEMAVLGMYMSRGKNGRKEDTTSTSAGAAQPELTRTKRRELKKQRAIQKQTNKPGIGENEDADFISLNHLKKKFNISDLGSRELSGKERKAMAKERYRKTEEARSDLARLKITKEEREAAQAKRKADSEAKAAEIEAKKAATSRKRVKSSEVLP